MGGLANSFVRGCATFMRLANLRLVAVLDTPQAFCLANSHSQPPRVFQDASIGCNLPAWTLWGYALRPVWVMISPGLACADASVGGTPCGFLVSAKPARSNS